MISHTPKAEIIDQPQDLVTNGLTEVDKLPELNGASNGHVAISGEIEGRKRESPWQWLRRQQLKIALGSVAVSTALGLSGEFDEVKNKIVETGPWVGSALAGSEAVWIGSAAIMLATVGSKIGNPLKIRERTSEIAEKAVNSRAFKTAFAVNVAASMVQTGVATEALTQLPPETWGFFALPAWNLSNDLMLISSMRNGIKKNSEKKYDSLSAVKNGQTEELDRIPERKPTISVRKATQDDAKRIAEIDLVRYRRVYGQNPPNIEENTRIFSEAIANAGSGWTYVCEVDGKVEGLVNAFRTDKSIEEFVSWEDSTADSTLEGKVDPNGRFLYVANLTVNPEAMKLGGEDMLIANLMAQSIQEGIEYGYWSSRMPLFSAWVRRQIRQGKVDPGISPEELDVLANHYANTTEVVDGKEVRIDHELRLYEEMGFTLERVVRDGFQDPPSMNYGVLFKYNIPPTGALKKSKIVRRGMAGGLRFLARNPKRLEKVLS